MTTPLLLPEYYDTLISTSKEHELAHSESYCHLALDCLVFVLVIRNVDSTIDDVSLLSSWNCVYLTVN